MPDLGDEPGKARFRYEGVRPELVSDLGLRDRGGTPAHQQLQELERLRLEGP